MFAHRFTKIAGHRVVAGPPGSPRLATAGTAGAITSADDAFLADIRDEGICL